MRYTFNVVTMMKEKVNTHFSFPLRLNMTTYTEDFLMGKGERKDGGLSWIPFFISFFTIIVFVFFQFIYTFYPCVHISLFL